MSSKDVVEFFKSITELFGDKYGVFKFFTAITPIVALVFWGSKRYFDLKKTNRVKNDLHPFLDEDDVKNATQNYIPTQCQDRPAEIDEEFSDGIEAANRMLLIKFFIKQAFKTDKQRFYLVLADAGMGKTTFMINLFLAYNRKIWGEKYIIKFVPLGDVDADNHILAIKDKQSTILLLDAFDEDPKAIDNCEDRLNEIIKNVQNFRKVIITCRTQFFPNEESEKFTMELPKYGGDGGVHRINKKYLSPFTNNDVNRYLRKKYSRFGSRQKAKKIINLASTLTVRPMLLDKIEDLLAGSRKFNDESQVFEELVNLWIVRESEKQAARTNENFHEQMLNFLLYAANTVYENFKKGEGLFLTVLQISELAEKYSIQLPMIDLTSRSLLNRNPKGLIKFSHKTILEYFLAKYDSSQPIDTIDFTSFDLGLTMKVQILLGEVLKRNFLVSNISEINSDDKVFRHHSHIDFRNVGSIIFAEKPDAVELSCLRNFPSLKNIYIASFLINRHYGKSIVLSIRENNNNFGSINLDLGYDYPTNLDISCKYDLDNGFPNYKIYNVYRRFQNDLVIEN